MNKNFSNVTVGVAIGLLFFVQFIMSPNRQDLEQLGIPGVKSDNAAPVAILLLVIVLVLLNANIVLDRLNKIKLGRRLFWTTVILELLTFFSLITWIIKGV